MCSTPNSCSRSCSATPPIRIRRTISARTSSRYIVKHGKAVAHRFDQSCVRSHAEATSYWRDVGTVDAYWAANIDLTDIVPQLDLYDSEWPIWTYGEITPPAKFVHDKDGRRGEAMSSLVSGGCIISGASLRHTLLFTGVRVHSYSQRRGRGDPALRGYRALVPAEERGGRRRGEDPARPGGRRGSRTRCQAIPPHRARHLPDHPADDRQART